MKLITMRDAVKKYVHNGATIAIEGFTAFICFAAAHEIIRQKKEDLTICRMTPDLIYDQMVAAGCARKMIFSYLGNPGVGSLHCIRRAIENGIPRKIEIEEYSHFGMVGRYMAGAAGLPFFPLKSYLGADIAGVNPNIRFIDNPYGNDRIAVVPALNPDVAFIHAQRCDPQGNTHLWGLIGMQKEVAFAAKQVIVVVEEIVDEDVIRSDPNRTLIPHIVVDAVVHQPHGSHPSYVQGYYDRDNLRYLAWETISRDQAAVDSWLAEWVFGVDSWEGYLNKLLEEEPDIWDRLTPGSALTLPVNYGIYG
ncbi:MAG: CoA transferase subunit A [Anaerolineales bacterium]|nr:CoA transferase subunit A [Anaerolineales bacterium]